MAYGGLESFICDYCERSFARKFNLRVHIENCHLSTTTSCEICHISFGSPAGLQLHLSRGHNRHNEGFPECDICGRTFKRKQNIVSHMTIHLQSTVVKCKLCTKTFTTQRNLKRHTYQIHNPDFKHLECNDCNKIFKGKHSLLAHIQTRHSSEWFTSNCKQCGKYYTNRSNLRRHIENFHTNKREFKCNLCPKVYNSNQSLRRHNRIRHNPRWNVKHKAKSMQLNCLSCGLGFKEEALLRQHIKLTHSFDVFYEYCKAALLQKDSVKMQRQEYFNCEFCEQVHSNLYDLKFHMRVHHDKEYCISSCNVCFTKFYCKETAIEHRKTCTPPTNVNSCEYCDKLFTDPSSLVFHTRIFHPNQSIDTSELKNNISPYKCLQCDRMYYSDRSLKHHVKLKHTSDEAVQCQLCGKVCNNKYYLASHMKIVHIETALSKCDYCDKLFKSKRNIRRHIEYTHLGMQRYKCIECETLFKEKRSLRKHVRMKHANSSTFPQCHLCHKRFESAKSCKIHLKLVHSFNLNTHPCHICSASFSAYESLQVHLQTKHSAEDEIYKCEHCSIVFKGQDKFERHNDKYHVNLVPTAKKRLYPRCVICTKDFSTNKTLKRHIRKFHSDFNTNDLASYGTRNRHFKVDCEHCIKNFTDEQYISLNDRLKHAADAKVFTCDKCNHTYSTLEFSIQRYRLTNYDFRGKMILSELCTAEMSDDDVLNSFGSLHDELMIKVEPDDLVPDIDIKEEQMSP